MHPAEMSIDVMESNICKTLRSFCLDFPHAGFNELHPTDATLEDEENLLATASLALHRLSRISGVIERTVSLS